MEIIKLDPTEIKITKARFRTEPGDVEGLSESIERVGQVLPIRITKDKELIDGGRRLAACLLLKKEIICVYDESIDDKDELLLRSMELEGNLYRKDFTAAEEAQAIRELHKLRQKIDPLHTVRDTAKILGRSSHSSIISSIKVADLVDAFPTLKNEKNKRAILRAANTIQTSLNAVVNVEKNEEKLKETGTKIDLKLADSFTEMENVEDESVDILITDPFYEINADKNALRVYDKYKGKFDDSYKGLESYKILAHESFRFTTKQSHGYIFVGPEHFTAVRNIFISCGWICFIKPLIWIKGISGQCNVPSIWPGSCYEMILYARKENSLLVKQGEPDWVSVKPLHGETKKHPYEKPVELIENLLDRSALPGQLLFDPFFGSGSFLEAGLKKNLFVKGFEKDEESYNLALDRLVNYTKN
jgi:site-specific DNA-methyltransferase (adenine-specific)